MEDDYNTYSMYLQKLEKIKRGRPLYIRIAMQCAVEETALELNLPTEEVERIIAAAYTSGPETEQQAPENGI